MFSSSDSSSWKAPAINTIAGTLVSFMKLRISADLFRSLELRGGSLLMRSFTITVLTIQILSSLNMCSRVSLLLLGLLCKSSGFLLY
jgi:hypothetical protein